MRVAVAHVLDAGREAQGNKVTGKRHTGKKSDKVKQ